VEIDEQGRVVKRRPPPGADRDLPEAFPAFEHNQWTFEGEIERLGAFARAVNRGSRAPRWLRLLLAGVVLLPFATGLLVVTWNTVFG
jgi:hypothetical protein